MIHSVEKDSDGTLHVKGALEYEVDVQPWANDAQIDEECALLQQDAGRRVAREVREAIKNARR